MTGGIEPAVEAARGPLTSPPFWGRTERIEREPSLLNPQSLVSFIVGDKDTKTFTVHKDFATFQSPVFDAAFNGQFIEGETQTMKLDDVEPDVFGVLIHWLYFKKLTGLIPNNTDRDSALRLAKVWVLGQRFDIPMLKWNVTCVLYERLSVITVYENITLFKELANFIYENDGTNVFYSPPWRLKSSLKLLIVNQISQAVSDTIEDIRDGMPEGIWIDISV